MVKTMSMVTSFFLALVLLISLNTVVSAQETTEISAYPGQTITNNKLGFQSIGGTLYAVYADPSGTAADWVSPSTIYFGTVYPGDMVWKTYTIRVPDDAIVGRDYFLTWTFYSERGYEDSVYVTIHVRAQTWLLIPWWIWIVIILVLAIAIPGIVIGVVVSSRKKKRRPPPPEVTPPETTGSGEV